MPHQTQIQFPTSFANDTFEKIKQGYRTNYVTEIEKQLQLAKNRIRGYKAYLNSKKRKK